MADMANSFPVATYINKMLEHSSQSSSSSSAFSDGEETGFLETKEKTEENEVIEKSGDLEKGDVNQPPKDKPQSRIGFVTWMVVNTLATIGIVFTNKAIFADPSLRLNQSTFAAFHFTVTGATLYAASRPSIGMFAPVRARFLQMVPLAFAMCLNVILPNLSLAFSSVAFYQIVRVLLTPLVAVINFVFYGTAIPRRAVYTLIPICLGVAMVSYYDTRPVKEARIKHPTSTTTPFGVCFALAGVLASSLYTVWIGTYHKKFNLNSMQLLFNQAPISAFLLLYVIPFTDQSPGWSKVPQERWVMILLSGVMASLINISQFFIVAGAGPVSSTVVGHVKTCSIVALGWATSGRRADDRGVLGILLAVCGIVAYSIIMYQHRQQQQQATRASVPGA